MIDNQLTDEEFKDWKSQIVISNQDKMGLRRPPFAFTEQGVAMLSAVLKSKTAIAISVDIMKAFVSMRRFILTNAQIFQRLETVENKQKITDTKLEKVLQALEKKDTIQNQGIFFNGEIFDAYTFVTDLIRKATKSIYIIDNYLDDTALTMLSKNEKKIRVKLYTKNISKQFELDIKKYSEQYGTIEVIEFTESHDRFLIIDEEEIYHFGASLKDLGKKWFAFSKMEKDSLRILERL